MGVINAQVKENCFFEILKRWVFQRTGVSIPATFLSTASGSLGFQYSSSRGVQSHAVPRVSILQLNDYTGLDRWLGIENNWHLPVAGEAAWAEMKPHIDAGESPVIRASVGHLPGLEAKATVTFMAVERYLPDEEAVEVFSLYYSGRLTLAQLTECWARVADFNEPAYSWQELRIRELPPLVPAYLYQILRQKTEPFLADEIAVDRNFGRFAADVELIAELPPLLAKIYVAGISRQMYHPLGPTATHTEKLNVLRELQTAGYFGQAVVDHYSALCQQWETLKLMFGKAENQPKQMGERLVQRIRSIAELEREALCLIQNQLKVG